MTIYTIQASQMAHSGEKYATVCVYETPEEIRWFEEFYCGGKPYDEWVAQGGEGTDFWDSDSLSEVAEHLHLMDEEGFDTSDVRAKFNLL